MTPLYSIGTQYLSAGKHPRLMTVTDIHSTYNAAGELIRVRYVAMCQLLGQTIVHRDVVAVTIAKGKAALEGQPKRATDAEIEDRLRDEIANTGEC